MTAPIDYRNYQDNKSGFISSLLSQNFIPYAKEIGIEPLRQQDHQVSYYSINDLFSIPGISNLPSVLYFQNLSNYDNVDLVEVRTQLAQLQSELKTVTDSIEYNDEVIKFFGDIATDVNDITGTVRESFNLDVENDVNFKQQVNASLSDEAINSFGLQEPETPYVYDETATGIAGQSNILTLGGNFYNKDGQYTNRNGEAIVGPDGNPKQAPYKKGDGWELFWQRGDIFEIQQRIVAAEGPEPER